MRALALAAAATLSVAAAGSPNRATADESRAVETIVLVRHGEKPQQGLGLLTCKGLNRSLKLPAFFAANFARPDFIFAPNTAVKVTEIHGDGQRYDYVRPLLTIGPTAVRLGVPVDTQIPFNDPGLLADTLSEPKYRSATIFVAWEHLNLVAFAEILLRRFENASPVPAWDNGNYDTVFVFRVDWPAHHLQFEVRSEDLGPISEHCPVG